MQNNHTDIVQRPYFKGSFFDYLCNMTSQRYVDPYDGLSSEERPCEKDENEKLLNTVDNFIKIGNNLIRRIKAFEQIMRKNSPSLFKDYMDYVTILTAKDESWVKFKEFKKCILTEIYKISKKVDEIDELLSNKKELAKADRLWFSKLETIFLDGSSNFLYNFANKLFLYMEGDEKVSKLGSPFFHTLCKIWNDGKNYFDVYYKLKKRELDELYHEKSFVSKYEGEKSIILHLLLKPEVRGFFSTYKQISSFGYIDMCDLVKSNLEKLKPKIIKVSEKLKAKKIDNIMEKIYGLTYVKDNVFIQYLPQDYQYHTISSKCFLEFDFRYEYDNFNPNNFSTYAHGDVEYFDYKYNTFNPNNSRTIFTLFFNTCEPVNHRGFMAETEWYKYSNVRRYRVGEFSCQGIRYPNLLTRMSTAIKLPEKAQNIVNSLRKPNSDGLNMIKLEFNPFDNESRINFLRAKRIKDIVLEANRIPNLKGIQYESLKIVNHPIDKQQDNRIFEKGFIINGSDVMYFEDFNDYNGEEKFRLTNKLQLTEPIKNADAISNMLCYNNTWKERWEAIKNPQDQEHNSIFDFREVFQSMPEEDQKGRVFSPNIPRVQNSIERDEELENTIIKRMETLEIIKNVQAYIKAEGRLIVTSKNMEKGSQYVAKDGTAIEETSITRENEQDANEQNAQIVGALNEVNQNIQPNQKFYE